MEVTCPACTARYSADDERLRGKTVRMRCRACETIWTVTDGQSGEAQSAPEALGAVPMPAASEPAPTEHASEKRAAVLRRGIERERRDLFATQHTEHHGSIKTTMRPPPMSAGTAARNENSVLFRVDQVLGGSPRDARRALVTGAVSNGNASNGAAAAALAPVTNVASAEAPAAPTSRDHSGIIDLRALSSMPPRRAGAVVAPLFSDAPPSSTSSGGFAREVMASSTSVLPERIGPFKTRLLATAAAAVAALAICGLGVAVAFGGEEPSAKATAAAFAPLAPPPPPVVSAPTAPIAPAPAAVAAADEGSASASTAKKAKHHTPKGGKSAGMSTTTTTTTKSSPPPRVSKPADTCGCHGDFTCILRCSAKGK